jgi:hypothetical protein
MAAAPLSGSRHRPLPPRPEGGPSTVDAMRAAAAAARAEGDVAKGDAIENFAVEFERIDSSSKPGVIIDMAAPFKKGTTRIATAAQELVTHYKGIIPAFDAWEAAAVSASDAHRVFETLHSNMKRSANLPPARAAEYYNFADSREAAINAASAAWLSLSKVALAEALWSISVYEHYDFKVPLLGWSGHPSPFADGGKRKTRSGKKSVRRTRRS